MGCDIHMWAEIRDDEGVWRLHRAPQDQIAREFEDMKRWSDGEPEGELMSSAVMHASRLYTKRNYRLFGILARVRWFDPPYSFGRGRGVPDVASSEYLFEVERNGSDGHSHSYLSVRELLDWPYWHALVGVDAAYADPVFRELFSQFETRLKTMSDDGSKAASLDDIAPRVPYRPITAADACETFYSETIPTLIRLGPPENVRIVFFFDN